MHLGDYSPFCSRNGKYEVVEDCMDENAVTVDVKELALALKKIRDKTVVLSFRSSFLSHRFQNRVLGQSFFSVRTEIICCAKI